MTHSFDIEIAKVVGANAATIFNHIVFWVEKHKAEGENFFEGKYWTYASRKSLEEIFPYLTTKQIRTATEKLVVSNLVVTGNFSEGNLNRTTWYTLSDNALEWLKKGQTDFTNSAKPNCEKGQNLYTDIRKKPISTNTIDISRSSKDSLNISICPEPLKDDSGRVGDDEPNGYFDKNGGFIFTSKKEQSASSQNPSKSFIELPTNKTGEVFIVTGKLVQEMKELYPAVDVEQEFRSMKGWLLSNPSNRKTKRGMTRFINNWLSRRQDKSRSDSSSGFRGYRAVDRDHQSDFKFESPEIKF